MKNINTSRRITHYQLRFFTNIMENLNADEIESTNSQRRKSIAVSNLKESEKGAPYSSFTGRSIALDERHQDSRNVFCCFLNYSVFQYTILLTSKFISFCVTLVNLLGPHTLILTGYFFFHSNSTILHTVHILLIFSSLFSLLSFFSSPHSPLSKLERICLYIYY